MYNDTEKVQDIVNKKKLYYWAVHMGERKTKTHTCTYTCICIRNFLNNSHHSTPFISGLVKNNGGDK